MTAINARVIEDLRRLQAGSPSFLAELIDLFLKEAVALMTTLRDTLALKDAQDFERAAHALKGSSRNLGAQAMSRLCSDLQAIGRAADWKRASELLAGLEMEFQQVRVELEAHKSV